MILSLLLVPLALATVAAPALAAEVDSVGRDVRSAVIANMPINADRRCLGISVVAEALFEGTPAPGRPEEPANELALRIYGTALTDQPITYPVTMLVDGRPVSTVSTKSLERLTSEVSGKYRRDYLHVISDQQGFQALTTAMAHPVATRRELNAVLRFDADGVEVFCGVGTRTFPDGTRCETNHAFLLADLDGDIVVYDPNDFAAPIQCRLAKLQRGLQLSWTCNYRDEQVDTEQTYMVISKHQYFAALATTRFAEPDCNPRTAFDSSFDIAWNSTRTPSDRVLRFNR